MGGTLSDDGEAQPVTNFVADQPPSYYSNLFRQDDLTGGHVILLGPGSESAAEDALSAWPGGMQVGGGVTLENARQWLDRGAAAVIVTSYVFREGQIDYDRLEALKQAVGRDRLVLDLSCRRRDLRYWIVTDRWQRFTKVAINVASLHDLSRYCFEFLVHAVDVEGLCGGVEEDLVSRLAEWSLIPVTYAGGVRSMEDVVAVDRIGQGKLDLTVGSALDLFGGSGVRYRDMVEFNRQHRS